MIKFVHEGMVPTRVLRLRHVVHASDTRCLPIFCDIAIRANKRGAYMIGYKKVTASDDTG